MKIMKWHIVILGLLTICACTPSDRPSSDHDASFLVLLTLQEEKKLPGMDWDMLDKNGDTVTYTEDKLVVKKILYPNFEDVHIYKATSSSLKDSIFNYVLAKKAGNWILIDAWKMYQGTKTGLMENGAEIRPSENILQETKVEYKEFFRSFNRIREDPYFTIVDKKSEYADWLTTIHPEFKYPFHDKNTFIDYTGYKGDRMVKSWPYFTLYTVFGNGDFVLMAEIVIKIDRKFKPIKIASEYGGYEALYLAEREIVRDENRTRNMYRGRQLKQDEYLQIVRKLIDGDDPTNLQEEIKRSKGSIRGYNIESDELFEIYQAIRKPGRGDGR